MDHLIIHQFEQRSNEWEEWRNPLITGSKFEEYTPKVRGSGFREKIFAFVEKQVAVDHDSNPMTWGTVQEESGLIKYNEVTGEQAVTCGGVSNTKLPQFGYSPDGIIYNKDKTLIRKVLEMKHPTSKVFASYVEELGMFIKNPLTEKYEFHCEQHQYGIDKIKRLDTGYYWQCVDAFLVIDTAEELDFFVYDPAIPENNYLIITVTRSEVEQIIEEIMPAILDTYEKQKALENYFMGL